MKKYTPLLLVLCLAFAGCPTADKYVRTIGDSDQAKIENIEFKLAQYEQNGGWDRLIQAERELQQIEKRGDYNKKYRAKLFGLFGMVYFYKNDKDKVKKYMEELEYTNKTEEYYFILKSYLETTPDARIMMLNQGIREADTNSIIRLHLANIYFSEDDYRDATALYDEALKSLPPEYTRLYKQKRDLAYHYLKNPGEKTDAEGVLKQKTLTMGQVTSYILAETNFLENITAKKEINPRSLLQKLKTAAYIHNPDLKGTDLCTRKDLAYLLLHILAYLKYDKSLLTKYSEKYLATGRKSPIPDIKTDAYYFDAVLVLVEREIMELPDGVNFFPDKTVSGIELADMLKKMKAQ